MAKDYDATLKQIVDRRPLDWLDLAGFPHDAEVRAIDPDLSSVSAAADKALRVGGDNPYVAHLEFQSGYDGDLDQRVLYYNVLFGWRHRLPVRSAVFLLSPKAAGSRINGEYSDIWDGSFGVHFRFRLIRVWELSLEQVLGSGIGTAPLALMVAAEHELIPATQRLRSRLGEVGPGEAAELMAAAYILAGMRHDEAVIDQLVHGALHMEESTTYQAIIRKGELKARRDDFMRAGRRLLGPPSAATEEAVLAITDPQELAMMFDRLFEVSSWDQLLVA